MPYYSTYRSICVLLCTWRLCAFAEEGKNMSSNWSLLASASWSSGSSIKRGSSRGSTSRREQREKSAKLSRRKLSLQACSIYSRMQSWFSVKKNTNSYRRTRIQFNHLWFRTRSSSQMQRPTWFLVVSCHEWQPFRWFYRSSLKSTRKASAFKSSSKTRNRYTTCAEASTNLFGLDRNSGQMASSLWRTSLTRKTTETVKIKLSNTSYSRTLSMRKCLIKSKTKTFSS